MLAIWQHPNESVSISTVVGVLMCDASGRTDIIASVPWVKPIAFQLSSRHLHVCIAVVSVVFLSSDCGAIMMLVPLRLSLGELGRCQQEICRR